MLSEDTINHFRFEGARVLLSVFHGSGIPVVPEEREVVLEPAIRALWQMGENGGRNLYEVAGEVRLIAEALNPDARNRCGVPTDLVELAAASAPNEPWRVLQDIALQVESWPSGFVAKLSRATPTSLELSRRFPQLGEFLLNYFGQDGMATEEDLTESEGLQLYIEHCHPICLWRLPRIAAECTEALTIFHDEESLSRFFETEHGLGSGNLAWSDWLPLIVETFTTHMREQHPPHWTSA
ncbi:hypothetical protein [Streptomyces sp. PSKA30]|uniref:hypothetical protein n=1 Tax=Streptomyces sp. PSKA30 TaxID=2874597 RepID=UPI001CD193FA|nr:hypothetical protein [Streptomyces sp. PSKA30]MBZ9641964.1 hypothetical protein [Streptomyces sp. PSKA30]